ncbi:unnamed protein product [Cylindrotheca closterium]|uniref:Uncharacterized protein n=1 Tax=Cylindrotheca closterium TaxID=2856 RepID=A0AAD2CID5_9STRA|nr:unnamed protein product [Cylindrotheca closterium]
MPTTKHPQGAEIAMRSHTNFDLDYAFIFPQSPVDVVSSQVISGMIPTSSSFKPMEQASNVPTPKPTKPTCSVAAEPTNRLAFPLATDMDAENLSPYQCYLREQIELFETEKDDMAIKAQGRNTPIQLGQVGIRCRHCAPFARSNRVTNGAHQFSMSVNGVYKVALKMGRLHFRDCPMLPEKVKKRLLELKQLPRKRGRGREYWKETLEVQGLVEDHRCLRFKPCPWPGQG